MTITVLPDQVRQPAPLAAPAPVASIRALVTATPPNHVPQKVALERARDVFASRMPFFPQLEQVFINAAIDTRHSCLPVEWFMGQADFEEKSRLYVEHATALAKESAERALAASGLAADEIDAIVFVSSTGISTPSIDARLMNLLPFRRDVIRLPIFGLGCAGGVLGLTRAAQLACSRPGMNCLLIVVELSSLAFRYDRLTKSNLVACALFGDGAAAAVLTSGAPGDGASITLGASGEHCWPDTLGVMGWNIDSNGLDVIFQQSIPQIIADDYPAALDGFLASNGLARSDIDRPCCHPGGAKVMDELEKVFGYGPGELDAERTVLRENGNMSAPTVLFVLDELLRGGASGRLLLSALGPGFTAAFQIVDVAQASRPS
ncbi:type III polyketide synthase [Kaistia dalseonensis]|uniref:Alkylresorcinol/alkylpyrone synthase n=1 Tax=Kaistia dalseonensis TaxID=410840 RepID=A0ABU0H3C4_9HYPH|nr:type III polyketide synthase [Kaistia dalseonensis]MCX5493981.1 type III polyketide synthase [Kaistia dalseonensis]MDQ0436557.1 alkylresorcinol/alkylpyrone synthase [Kaistia dalseonensis]